jgi:hypothetical protein
VTEGAGFDLDETALGETAASTTSPDSRPFSDLDRGDQVGRYLILSRLGAGGMGVVYAAYDPELDRKLAIKLLHVQSGASRATQGRERLLREAQAMAQLTHPNVIAVHDVGTLGDRVFVAMEFVEGRTLEDALPEASEGWRGVLELFLPAGRGLAAAHSAGLIHRDFKPENVMVGDDGRVRVLDFGLARAQQQREETPVLEELPPSASRSRASSARLTQTGAVMGTPAYMAPEQHLGLSTTAATDQFSFCVALHEALFGERPFPGETLAALAFNVTEGRRRGAPKASTVPGWLRRAVNRGLDVDPERRWPSMEALLTALEHFRVLEQRRRRLLIAGGSFVVAGLAFSGWLAWQSHVERRAAERLEAEASELLRVVDAQLDEDVDAGRLEEADRVFRSFLGRDELNGTSAIAGAWMSRAKRRGALGRFEEQLEAHARAYVSSNALDSKRAALFGLADSFRKRWMWDELETVTNTLVEEAQLSETDARILESRVAVAAAHRRLSEARRLAGTQADAPGDANSLTLIEPVLRALDGAVRVDLSPTAVAQIDIDGDDKPELVFAIRETQELVAVRADPSLEIVDRRPFPGKLKQRLTEFTTFEHPGEERPLLFVSVRGAGKPDSNYLLRWGESEMETVHSWSGELVVSSADADISGDGRNEHYLGVAWNARDFYELVEEADDRWELRRPHPPTAHAQSDILGIESADTNADGKPELWVAAGPWRAYDLRALGCCTADGELEILGRQQVGSVSGLHPFLLADGSQVVVGSRVDRYPNARVFPADTPYGIPSGIYAFWLNEGGIQRKALELPPSAPVGVERSSARHTRTADLDGDTTQDLLFDVWGGSRHGVMVYRQLEDGRFVSLLLGSMTLLDVIEIDDDPTPELLVTLRDHGREVWVLGAGTDSLPVFEETTEERVTQEPPAAADPEGVYFRTWSRAEDLLAMGLYALAAEVFAEAAVLAPDSKLQAAARFREAQMWELAGEDGTAASRFEEASQNPEWASRGLEAALEARLDAHEFGEARRLNALLLASSDGQEHARRRVNWLDDLAEPPSRVEFDFSRRLGDAWQIFTPGTLEWDPRRGGVRVQVAAGIGELATVPVEVTGDRVSLTIELDVERTEWESGVSIALRPKGAKRLDRLGLEIRSEGGARIYNRDLACASPGSDQPDIQLRRIDGPGHTETVTATIDFVRSLQDLRCDITSSSVGDLHGGSIPMGRYYAPGEYELVIQSLPASRHEAPLRASFLLRRIEILGAVPATSIDTPQTRANRHLSNGLPQRALEAYALVDDPTWKEELGRAIALSALGQPKASATALRSSVEGAAQMPLGVLLAFRLHRTTLGPAFREVLGSRYPDWYERAWKDAITLHDEDTEVVSSLTQDLEQSDLAGGASDDRPPHFPLLLARAAAWWAVGDVARAERDIETVMSRASTMGKVDPDDERSARLLHAAHLRLAEMAIKTGDEQRALESARSALHYSRTPLLTRDALERLDPRLVAESG